MYGNINYMSLIIDKRFLPKNQSSGSRQKFIDRYKSVIKKRIRDIVEKGSIKNFDKGNKRVKIDTDDLDTPGFEFETGTGNTDRIYVGNKNFKKGQKIRKQQSGESRGRKAGNGDGGEDDFEFILTEKEFSDLFFEDLVLPDLLKREFLGSCTEIRHAGFSSSGGPTSLNIKKTMMNALGRRIALNRKIEREKVETELEKQLKAVDRAAHTQSLSGRPVSAEWMQKKKLQYIEDMDLKYNFKDRVDVPITKAVMFCLMDVSGSMGEEEKDFAKRFYILLNMFLKRNYSVVDIVFIRHTESAQEVDEDTFFHDRQSGGTVISSGYEKINEIISTRYNPEQWNIYVAQASDGDNWEEDMTHMEDLLINKILPKTQYFAYIDVTSENNNYRTGKSIMMKTIERLMTSNKNLQGREVNSYKDIFPVFRSLFKKKGV